VCLDGEQGVAVLGALRKWMGVDGIEDANMALIDEDISPTFTTCL